MNKKERRVSRLVERIVKINEKTVELPMPLLIVIVTILMVLSGVALSKYQMVASTISQVFTVRNLMMLALITMSMILTNLACMILVKTARIKKINSEYMRLEYLVHDSKISDINQISSGKIYDAVKDLAAYNAHELEMYVGVLPTLIPFATLLWKEWKASPIAAIVTVGCIIASVILVSVSDKITGFTSAAKSKGGEMSSVSVDNFLNVKTFKYLGKSEYAHKRQVETQKETVGYFINPIQYIFMKSAYLISAIPMIVNIILNRNNLEMIAFIIMTDFTINRTINTLLNIAQNKVERNAQLDAIESLKGDDTATPKDMPQRLILKNIDFDYGEDSTRFHIDDLRFIKGRRYHVTGESGQGKSSLANLIVGAITPTRGRIPKIKTFYVYQETEMLNDTLRNNMTFGDKSIHDDELIELIKQVNLYDWFVEREDGLDTLVGERGCKLSSGQKQRVNIIRAILRMREHNDEVIILDEITSNLDSATEEIVIDLINQECNGTLIVISHHGGFDEICDHCIKVENHEFNLVQNSGHVVDVQRRRINA